MPAERGKDAAERFAAAVDRGRSPLSAGSDQDLARELEIVAALRSQDGTYASHAEAAAMLRSPRAAEFGPRPDERARAKQRLMAMLAEEHAAGDGERPPAPVVELTPPSAAERTAPIPVVARIDESDAEPDADLAPVTPLAGRAAHRTGRHGRPASRVRNEARSTGLGRRAGLVGSAALLVLVAFTGAGLFASRDALPGQTLYPLKRAAEAAGLAMTFDDQARAQRNLELAAIRLSEVEQLVALKGGSGIDPQLVQAAMQEFDTATSEGSRTLLSDRAANGGGLGSLQAWVATQSARISALRPALPDRAVPAADTSIALLDSLLGGSPQLETRAPTPTDRTNSVQPTSPDGAPQARTAPEQPGPAGPTEPAPEQGGLGPIPQDGGALGQDPNVAPNQPQTPEQTDQNTEPKRLPLPLPGAPVTLPPLLPGMPPISIG